MADDTETKKPLDQVKAQAKSAIKNVREQVTEKLAHGEGEEGKASFVERVRNTARGAAEKVNLGGVGDKLKEAKENGNLDNVKEKGLMVGGAIVAADGLRRAAKKDSDGKRHMARGVAQAALGVGSFAAGIIAQRAGKESGEGGPER